MAFGLDEEAASGRSPVEELQNSPNRRVNQMLSFRLTISSQQRKGLEAKMRTAQQRGDLRTIKYVLAIFAAAHYQTSEHAARVLQLSEPQVLNYIKQFLIYGVDGVGFKKPRGRKSKLTKGQQRELCSLIDQGPQACGFDGGCWRSPMIQKLILDRFGVCYDVFYIAQLLHNLGFSFQRARFVSDHLDEQQRRDWLKRTWPQALALARQQGALLLFGDEASFPQWGTLNYTWARKGHQPQVRTSGRRKSYKVLGLIDYFSGRFFYSATSQRLTSDVYQQFLLKVLDQTTQPIVLIQDGAPYHTQAKMKQFFAKHAQRLTVFQLPTYSPDLNPIEKLWKKIKQQDTHMIYFPTFEALTTRVDEALLKFANASQEILALFGQTV
jgi:transposase